MNNRRDNVQVKRAVELARAAGLNPYELEDRTRHRYVYDRFMDAAFDEHFARVAVDNVYWHQRGSFYSDGWDIPRRDDDYRIFYGRCKSGQRWFWHIFTFKSEANAYGWADTEEQARADATTAIKQYAGDRRVIVTICHGFASDKLKELNKVKRVKRWTNAPADGSDTHAIEHLYDRYESYRITKETAQRIYYIKADDLPDNIGFVPRHRVAEDWPGSTWRDLYEHEHRLGYRKAPQFFLKPCPYPDRDKPPEIDLRQLKAEMAAAHPDRGGSSAAFIEARAAYEDARKQQRRNRTEATQ